MKERGNTLAVAPTGAGKTIMLADLARRMGGRQCVLQHRQELTSQNLTKFKRVNPGAHVGLYSADVKSWRGDTTFAMVRVPHMRGDDPSRHNGCLKPTLCSPHAWG